MLSTKIHRWIIYKFFRNTQFHIIYHIINTEKALPHDSSHFCSKSRCEGVDFMKELKIITWSKTDLMVQRNKFAHNMKSDTMYCLLVSHCPPLPCTRNLTAAGPLPRPRRWALNQSNDSYFTYQAWPVRLNKMYTAGSWERFSPLWKITQATPSVSEHRCDTWSCGSHLVTMRGQAQVWLTQLMKVAE